MSAFDTMCNTNFAVTLDTFGVAATLTDSAGTEYSVNGVLTPRNDAEGLDADWLERAAQAEFFCEIPTGFAITPSSCFVTVGGVTYCVMEGITLDGNNARMLLERRELKSIQHRGRRY